MAKLFQPPPKFVHSEWIIANQHLFANCETERAAAERLVLDSHQTIDDTTRITQRVVDDSQKRLEQRVEQIKHWENELNVSLEENKNETAAMVEMRKRLEKMIEMLREYLHIAQQCLSLRQKRVQIDLVHDNAEKELIKEVEVIQGALALLVRTNEQVIEQIRLNRKVKYHLDNDLADKFVALGVDTHNTGLHPGSKGTEYHAGKARISGNSVTPEEWIMFTERNLTGAEKQRQNSVILRQICDGTLQSTYNDLLRQKECTDDALEYRINETRETKAKIEEHLKKILRQIIEVEDNITRLQLAIENPISKPNALKMTETRLDNRLNRPGNELCRDLAQYSLIETDQTLRGAIADIELRLERSHESLKGLDRKKLELEHQLGIKTETLFIDETECMGMRRSISIQCY